MAGWPVDVRWITASLDDPATPAGEQAEQFWLEVTGTRLSPRRGSSQEFATLLPPDADAFLRVQRVLSDQPGVHLDLHVEDPAAAVDAVVAAGARIEAERDVVVLSSPGGMVFCVVGHRGEARRPQPVVGPGGRRSLVDQVCLDIPAEAFEREAAFWAAVTGWPLQQGSRPEFSYLERPPTMPLRLLLQRLDQVGPGQQVRAHLDLASDDRHAEAQAHEDLGATIVRITQGWTTLRDPVGRLYCVTGRDPLTGRLPSAAG